MGVLGLLIDFDCRLRVLRLIDFGFMMLEFWVWIAMLVIAKVIVCFGWNVLY